VASVLAGELEARGPAMTVSLACASGAAAIVEAVRALRRGVCDVALAGGVGGRRRSFMLAGFGILGALSARGSSCPFDVRRDGFVVGEGAAMVLLSVERGDAACRVTGVGRSVDAFHLTAPDPDGDGAARAMRAALDDAGRDAVDCVQAHGTSTPLNDAVEALAIQRVLGERLAAARVSSVKGALGHWIAGAGAVGALAAVEAVTRGIVLPTAGLREPDPRCNLPHVLGRAAQVPARSALVNAFAFGGANACLVMEAA
jgi:3-oxoacyl-[acyl-carrier-protein] synthase II